MFKKFVSMILTLTLILLCAVPASAANDGSNSRPSVEEILDEYHERCLAVETISSATTFSASANQQLDVIKDETIDALWDAGYAAYDVNPDTFTEYTGILIP